MIPPAIASLLRSLLADIRIVCAPRVAKGGGSRSRSNQRRRRRLLSQAHERSVSGIVCHDRRTRTVAINEIEVDALVAPAMIYVSNEGSRSFIGRFASVLGNAAIDIATFALGQDGGGSAIALEMDGQVPENVLADIATSPGVKEATGLAF